MNSAGMAPNVLSVLSLVFVCFCMLPKSLAQETDDCVCVMFHLCVNGTLIRDGGVGVDERSSFPGQASHKQIPCKEPGSVCCPKGQLSETATVPSTKEEDQPGPLIQPEPSRPSYLPKPGGYAPKGHEEDSTKGPTIEVNDPTKATQDAVFNPHPGHCGVKRVTLKRRISFLSQRKSVAEFAEFPWMLAILVPTDPGMPLRFHCGASLIHRQVALTAAHCIDRVSKSALRVRAGEWNTMNTEEPLPHQDRKVSHVEIHPYYSNSGLKHDIALLFLDYPFDINDNVDLICLPNRQSIFTGMQCTATGWGKDPANPHITHHEILHKVDLPIISGNECQERLRKSPRLGPYYDLHLSSMCAGGEPDKDACKGDGGGPLVCPTGQDDSSWVQAGIVSWGIGCGTKYPGVYTDVSVHTEWIYQKIFDFEQSFVNTLPIDLLYRYFPDLNRTM